MGPRDFLSAAVDAGAMGPRVRRTAIHHGSVAPFGGSGYLSVNIQGLYFVNNASCVWYYLPGHLLELRQFIEVLLELRQLIEVLVWSQFAGLRCLLVIFGELGY